MSLIKSSIIDLRTTQCGKIDNLAFQEIPLSWYPVECSALLKTGEKKLIKFFGKDWVLFRDKDDGKLGVISRYCKHMGADLSRGQVKGEHLCCPLHHWPYDANGTCHAEIGDSLRRKSSLETLSVAEYAGIIFIFSLTKPLFELPRLTDNNIPHISRTKNLQIPIHFLAPALNTFDVAHYRNVHNREIIGEPTINSIHPSHLSIHFKAQVINKRWQDRVMSVLGFKVVDISIDCWGGNVLIMKNRLAGVGAVVAAIPTEKSNSTLYLTAFELVNDGPPINNLTIKNLKSKIKLEASLAFTIAFLRADVAVLTGIQPCEGILVPGLDDIAKKFWNYLNKLPTFDANIRCQHSMPTFNANIQCQHSMPTFDAKNEN